MSDVCAQPAAKLDSLTLSLTEPEGPGGNLKLPKPRPFVQILPPTGLGSTPIAFPLLLMDMLSQSPQVRAKSACPGCLQALALKASEVQPMDKGRRKAKHL